MTDRVACSPSGTGRVHAESPDAIRARSSAPRHTTTTSTDFPYITVSRPTPAPSAEAFTRDEPNLDTSRGPVGESRRGLVDSFTTGLPLGDERH